MYLESFIELTAFTNNLCIIGESCESYYVLQAIGYAPLCKGIEQLLGSNYFGHLWTVKI